MKVTDKNARGKYLSKNALKTWQEDFIDEDTGEVVSIERNEVIVRRGALLDDLTISLLSENGITDIEVSEIKRLGSWDNSRRKYEVVASVPRQFHGKTKKVKEVYLTHEYSAAEAEARVVDELEKSCEGEFKIFKVAVSNIDRIILGDGDKWYKAVIKYSDLDDKDVKQSFLIHSDCTDNALSTLHKDDELPEDYSVSEVKDTDFVDVYGLDYPY